MLEHEEKLISQLKAEVDTLKIQNQNSAQELINLNTQLIKKD
jgi:hypothetical protein